MFVEVVDIVDEATFKVCREHRVVKEKGSLPCSQKPTHVGAQDATVPCLADNSSGRRSAHRPATV